MVSRCLLQLDRDILPVFSDFQCLSWAKLNLLFDSKDIFRSVDYSFKQEKMFVISSSGLFSGIINQILERSSKLIDSDLGDSCQITVSLLNAKVPTKHESRSWTDGNDAPKRHHMLNILTWAVWWLGYKKKPNVDLILILKVLSHCLVNHRTGTTDKGTLMCNPKTKRHYDSHFLGLEFLVCLSKPQGIVL